MIGGTPVAGAARLALWAGQEDLSTSESGAGHTDDAVRDSRGTPGSTQDAGAERAPEYGVRRTGETDAPPGCGSLGAPDLGDSAGHAIAPGISRVVARVLPLCATTCVLASAAYHANRAGWETQATAVSRADAGDGSRTNASMLDGQRLLAVPSATNTSWRWLMQAGGSREGSLLGRKVVWQTDAAHLRAVVSGG